MTVRPRRDLSPSPSMYIRALFFTAGYVSTLERVAQPRFRPGPRGASASAPPSATRQGWRRQRPSRARGCPACASRARGCSTRSGVYRCRCAGGVSRGEGTRRGAPASFAGRRQRGRAQIRADGHECQPRPPHGGAAPAEARVAGTLPLRDREAEAKKAIMAELGQMLTKAASPGQVGRSPGA